MIPVDQTILGEKGNCFSACLASILELPIVDVPNFVDPEFDNISKEWNERSAPWLRSKGYVLVTYGISDVEIQEELHFPWCRNVASDVYWIAGGESPRRSHAVVYRGDKMVHDPHPSREGLVKLEDATFLIPINYVTKKLYSKEQIREVFWKTFHKAGELWFDYFEGAGGEENCEHSTNEHWENFEDNLNKIG